MVQYRNILADFLKARFGPSIGEQLLSIQLKKRGIERMEDLDSKPLKEQQDFVAGFLTEVFGEFYTEERIFHITVACLLRFALIDAAHTVEDKTSLKTTFAPISLKRVPDYHHFETGRFDPQDKISLAFKVGGAMEGHILISYADVDALKLGRLLSQTAAAGESISNDKAQEQLYRFYELILPVFTDVIEQALGISFTFERCPISEIDDLRSQDVPVALIDTTLESKVGNQTYKGITTCFVQNLHDDLRRLVEEHLHTHHADPTEVPITIDPHGDRMVAICDFFKGITKKELPTELVETIMKRHEIHSLENVKLRQLQPLIDDICRETIGVPSSYDKSYINKNIKFLFGYEQKE